MTIFITESSRSYYIKNQQLIDNLPECGFDRPQRSDSSSGIMSIEWILNVHVFRVLDSHFRIACGASKNRKNNGNSKRKINLKIKSWKISRFEKKIFSLVS